MAEQGLIRAEQYLAPETLAQLSPFELRAKMIVEGVMNGMHRSPYKGLAVEFAEHRQYVPGDETRHLDWKVYGRTDKLYLKQYQQETNLDVILLVDASGSMRYSSLGTKPGWGGTQTPKATWTKYDHATATSVALAHLCLQQRDRIGLATFASDIRSHLKPSNMRDQWRAIVQLLSQEPVEESTNLVKVADQILSSVTNRALFFIVSDLLFDPAQTREAIAKFRHKRHDVVLVQILDPKETEFNFDASAPFEGFEGEPRLHVDTRALRARYLEVFHEHEQQLETASRGLGFDLERLETDKSIGPGLASLFSRRLAVSRKSSRG